MAFSDQSEAWITLVLTNQRNDESLCLQVLIGILQRRIELDKEVLFQFNTIKHEAGLVDLQEKNPTIAPTLMKFQRGCHQVRGGLIILILGLIICLNPRLSLMSVCHAASVMQTKQVASCKTPQNMTILHPANQSQVSEGAGDQSEPSDGSNMQNILIADKNLTQSSSL